MRSKSIFNGHTNRLGLEKSPYLLQHADNPVDWYPWGDEAFEKAARENKPVFLSIGYSTCHWCHVMEHESFEDTEVADLMNRTLISVKVDREERPDIDGVYMTVCQMMTGSGGWPLSIIMTPDKKPFFADTYIPKESRFGKMGMLDLIPRIAAVWARQQGEVLESAKQIASALQTASTGTSGEELGESILQAAFHQFVDNFDAEHGGFNGAPKFPTPHNLTFLLRCWKRYGESKALEMVEKTLGEMSRGGIYDQIGFGFHRYSTDAEWLVPHFEKMLYDQALLAMAYTEAYQATRKEDYARTAQEILEYVFRDMTAPEGGFYSAEDADSEGLEGKFYLWSKEEIETVLSREEADMAIRVFNIRTEGNFAETGLVKDGRNILHQTNYLSDTARQTGISEDSLVGKIEAIQRKLFSYREKRIHPFKDDKILTDWNGLMIAALAKAASAFQKKRYAEAAGRAADFILDKMRTAEGRLVHRSRGGEGGLTGNIDDYAFFIWGLIELYEATFKVDHLKSALELNKDMIQHFGDPVGGGFYFSADDGESLLVRQKEIYDGAIPSGNSVAMLNLLRLGRLTGDTELEKRAAEIGKAFYAPVLRMPSAHSQLLSALDFALGTSFEIVIAGRREAADTRKMLEVLAEQFLPNKVVILRPGSPESSEIDRIALWTKDHREIGGKTTAYVCRGYHCELPVMDVIGLAKLVTPSEDSSGSPVLP